MSEYFRKWVMMNYPEQLWDVILGAEQKVLEP